MRCHAVDEFISLTGLAPAATTASADVIPTQIPAVPYGAPATTTNLDSPNESPRDDVSMAIPKVSAFIISYNRADTIATCLKSASFADEIILVDKGSTDGTADIARPLVDRLVVVPWTPSADDTRQFAESLCTYDWIVFLDDDECLNVDLAHFILSELEAPRADFYWIPFKHYILGEFSENAYCWPEHHVRFYKRGAISFSSRIHANVNVVSENGFRISEADGPAIEHFSHRDVAQWIEKTNRYTAQPERHRMVDENHPVDIVAYAHAAIDRWVARSKSPEPGSHVATLAVLRAVYDIVDRLKMWEEERGRSGQRLFAEECEALDRLHEAAGLAKSTPRAGKSVEHTGVMAAQPKRARLRRSLQSYLYRFVGG